MNDYHLSFFGPLKNEYVDWPEDSVSVYHISGDEIAQRVGFDGGKVVRRDSWCGFLGCFRSLDDAMKLIAEHRLYVAFAKRERETTGRNAVIAFNSWRK